MRVPLLMKRNRTPSSCGLLPRRQLALLVLALNSATLHAQVLPPPPAPADRAGKLPTETRLFVRGYRFEGNSAFSDAELSKVTEAFANREVTSGEIEQARRAVTLHYINHGYVNSGAVIPDQTPWDSMILIRITEGVLSGIELHGNAWLSDSYINGHVRRWSTAPLNLNELKDGLQVLRQNPNVKQINAELKPGSTPGQGRLDLRVLDQQPFRLGLQVDNQRPPSVGEDEIWLLASDLNLTGHSDPLDLRYGVATGGSDGFGFSGADNIEGSYLLPITRYDTTLGLHASRLNTSLVEATFTPLDITSLTASYGIALRQPVYQTANREIAFSVGFDRRQNDSWLLGVPFNISRGAVNGEMVVSVLRLTQEWLQRGQNSVLALRSSFNFGLDALDATNDRIPGHPKAEFFSWLGQGQYVRRLFNTQNQLVLRVTGQWTDDRLLALEQMSVGGAESVRGYLENQLVRDRGVVSSMEFRLPVLFDKTGAGILHLAPFFDFGGGWDVGGSSSPTTIYSTGIGLLLAPDRHISAQLYCGYRLAHVAMPVGSGAEGLGLNFKVNLAAF
jgi:hemolysin activation/secretion protein